MSVTGNVLVLGSDERAFLSVIRSLGRSGLCVHVGMCPPDAIALRSRYIAARHEIPKYSADNTEWLDVVKNLARTFRYDLIIPCNDPSLIPVQLHQDELSKFGGVYSLGDRAFEIAFDKIASTRLARELGLYVPREMIVPADTSVESILADIPLPVVVKPPSSFVAESLSHRRAVRRARSRDGLADILAASISWGMVQIQENFIGEGVGVEVLARNGVVLVAFQHVRVHEPLAGGGSSYRRSVPLQSDLLAATERLMAALDYTGVAMVEFKVNPRTGKWIFIEINGRFWGSLPLAIAAGADFPRYLYEMMVTGRRKFPRHYAIGIHCRNLAKDRCWMQDNLSADRSDPVLATRPLWKVALEVLNLVMLRERFDTFVIDDIGPGLATIAKMLRVVQQKISRVLRHKLVAVPFIRRHMVRRAVRAVRRARTILFVCKGNICRSPFAEQLARQRLDVSADIISSGYFPRSGRSSPEAALEAAGDFGVNLKTHRSRRLNDTVLKQADIVFVFDEHNRNTLRREHPSVKGKLFPLGIMLATANTVICDPWSWSGDVTEFSKAYTLIAQAIERLKAEMPIETLATKPIGTLATNKSRRSPAKT